MEVQIKTEEDVEKWAENIVKAKGTKFTPLTKNEQYIIAMHVLSLSSRLIDEELDNHPPVPPTPLSADTTPAELPSSAAVEHSEPMPPTDTRAGGLHNMNLDAQGAFDLFLKDTAGHPSARFVMDFSTGEKSIGAAFAYWLMGGGE